MAINAFPIPTLNVDENEFPKLILVEVSAASVPTPPAGEQTLFIDSTTHHLCRKNSSGVVVDLETIRQVLPADPASPVNGQSWITDDGGSPASIALKFRKGGVTYTLAEVTV